MHTINKILFYIFIIGGVLFLFLTVYNPFQRHSSLFARGVTKSLAYENPIDVCKDIGHIQQETGTYFIAYTASGYQPDILQVPVKSEVTFVNCSSIGMWTASDPHPVHTDYSAFDSRSEIATGESRHFHFNEIGTFGYHNHAKSLHRGVVRVYDPSNTGQILPEKTLPKGRQTRDKLLKILIPGDSSSIRTLFDTIKADRNLLHDCHDMAHDLGHEAYEIYGFSRALTYDNADQVPLNDVDDICAGGYMHGVLEELFAHRPEIKQNPDLVCQGISQANQGSCYHGVGHGIMFAYRRNLQESVKACGLLEKSVSQHRCYEGVYMELFWGDTSHADGYTGWDMNHPFDTCKTAGEEDAGACYLYAHLGYLRTHPNDFQGIMNKCAQNTSLGNFGQRYCIKGIGITMMKRINSAKLSQTEILTQGLSLDLRRVYYEGVLGYAMLSGISKKALTPTCEGMSRDKAICYAVLDSLQ